MRPGRAYTAAAGLLIGFRLKKNHGPLEVLLLIFVVDL